MVWNRPPVSIHEARIEVLSNLRQVVGANCAVRDQLGMISNRGKNLVKAITNVIHPWQIS
jgi:hypothetical protein